MMMNKYVVEGWLSKSMAIVKEFDSADKANKYAEDMANKYLGKSFNVLGPNDISGLTDCHWQYSKDFDKAVRFIHND